jgi:altronate dehydratase large subunit
MKLDGLTGYKRGNGTVGVRNHVVVLAAADNVNPLARQLADQTPGVAFIRASFGRGQLGDDFKLALRTMAGMAAHPNVSDCLIVSFELASAQRVAERVHALGRTVTMLSLLDEGGVTASLRRGQRILQDMQVKALQGARVPIALTDLIVGLECGGSDVTSGLIGNPCLGGFTDYLIGSSGTAIFSEPVECLGAESILQARAASPEIGAALLRAVARRDEIAKEQGTDLLGANPTADNIAGGLSTIEEKSLGALAKSGTRRIEGLLDYAERPPRPGLWMMDAPSAAVENITALTAGGCQVIMFVTGSGNPVGHPLAPTIKICANPRAAQRMAEHIDVDLSAALLGKLDPAAGTRAIAASFARVVNGELAAAERLDYVDTTISRIAQST